LVIKTSLYYDARSDKHQMTHFSCLFFFAVPNYSVYKTVKLGYICSIASCWTETPGYLKDYLEFFAVLQTFVCIYSTTSRGKPLRVLCLNFWHRNMTFKFELILYVKCE
jgi:hypothetical protein